MPSPSIGNKLELIVLRTIASLGSESYGLSIRKEIESGIGIDYSIGAIYTTLSRLEKKGLVSSTKTEPSPVRGGRSRRQFSITALGRKTLNDAEALALLLWNNTSGVST